MASRRVVLDLDDEALGHVAGALRRLGWTEVEFYNAAIMLLAEVAARQEAGCRYWISEPDGEPQPITFRRPQLPA